MMIRQNQLETNQASLLKYALRSLYIVCILFAYFSYRVLYRMTQPFKG